jgi:hypothetical protein
MSTMHPIIARAAAALTPRNSTELGANALAALAAVMAFRFGHSLGHDTVDSLILGSVFALGAGFSLTLLDIGLGHWRSGRRLMGVATCLTWGFVIALEIVGHTSFGAYNRAAGMQAATLHQTAFEDSSATEAFWVSEVAKLQAGKRPGLTKAEAQSVIDASHAHRYWVRTDGCKKAPGPQTTTFCQRYFDATSALTGWEIAVVDDTKLAAAQAALEKARAAKVAALDNDVSSANVQGMTLASIGTLSRNPSQDAVYWMMVVMSLATGLFMAMSGIIKAAARTEGTATKVREPEVVAELMSAPVAAAKWLFGEVGHIVNPAAPGIAMTAAAGLGNGSVGTLRAA